MILLLGGTTEGRMAAQTLEAAGNPFYYSTKTGEQQIDLQHGRPMAGAMDVPAMEGFCRQHGIRLIVDAAHPFARQLHDTVAQVAAMLSLPAIRFERIYPPRDPDIVWIDNYDQLPAMTGRLLATTGVQSIAALKGLEKQGIDIVWRILPWESSRRLARQQGARDDQLCYWEDGGDQLALMRQINPQAILLKESGLSGSFGEKVAAARQLGIRIFALKRPETPAIFHRVNGVHGLRRAVEQFLPEFYPLHSGLTTGTCATAAAVAAATSLLKGQCPETVPVRLPDGETLHLPVQYGQGYAACVKDAGDDPDVTDGLEIRARVEPSENWVFLGGEGIGRFTLPGFDYPPGEPAINKGPRQMLRDNLQDFGTALRVTLSVPGGEAIARRTFNPRLGIEGGISIIGVSGIVMPFSEEAFIDSIRKCLAVAQAAKPPCIVIHSGAKSEGFLRDHYPDLPAQAFVEYGNHIGATLQMACQLGIGRLSMGLMLGKAVKLAAGHLDTHSRRVVMDKDFIADLMRQAHCDAATVQQVQGITLARELWDIVPATHIEPFCQTVLRHCLEHCRKVFPQGELCLLLIDEKGGIHPLSADQNP